MNSLSQYNIFKLYLKICIRNIIFDYKNSSLINKNYQITISKTNIYNILHVLKKDLS